mgnify:CR=1 FL=1
MLRAYVRHTTNIRLPYYKRSHFNAETVFTAKNVVLRSRVTKSPVIKSNTFFSKHALNAPKQIGHQNSGVPTSPDIQIHHGNN